MSNSISDDVWILGITMTKFGKHPDKDTVDLASEAALGALRDGGVSMRDMGILAAGCLMQSNAGIGQQRGSRGAQFLRRHRETGVDAGKRALLVRQRLETRRDRQVIQRIRHGIRFLLSRDDPLRPARRVEQPLLDLIFEIANLLQSAFDRLAFDVGLRRRIRRQRQLG